METSPKPPSSRLRRRILPLYMLFMFLAPFFVQILIISRGSTRFEPFSEAFKLLGYVCAALLLGLFAVLLFTPSNSKELDRVLDTEASTVTLGMTMYMAWFYPLFEEVFSAPKLNGLMVVGFIFFTYSFARQILRMKYR